MIKSELDRESIMHLLQDSGTKFSITASGCCASILSWFTLYTGSSKSTIEASAPYSKGAIDKHLGFTPEKYASQEVSDLTAKLNFIDSQNIYMKEKDWIMTDRETIKYFGVGINGVVATSRKINGGHRCFMSMYTETDCTTVFVKLLNETMSRVNQDLLLSDLFLLQIALKCGVKLEDQYKQFLDTNKDNVQVVSELVRKHDLLDLVIDRGASNIVQWANGKVTLNTELHGFVVVSGSFDPLHQGHLDLANLSADMHKISDHKVIFEIALNNADKGAIDKQKVLKRMEQFKLRNLNVMVSNHMLFTQKNEYLHNGVFALGFDTYKRLFDVRYYDNSMEVLILKMGEFLRKNNRFVVFKRRNPLTHLVEDITSVPVPSIVKPLIFENKDYLNDISSTMLRAELVGQSPEKQGNSQEKPFAVPQK